jgi:hypothetical protein
MTGRDIYFVAFHDALQHFGRTRRPDPGAQLLGHRLHVAHVEVEFPGDLLVRQVQAHEVKTQDPEPQRLMMAGENSVGEVVEARLTGQAPVALPVPLPLVMAVSRHLVAAALRALHALGPTQMPDGLEASGIVDQGLDVDQAVHRGRLLPADNRAHPRRQDRSAGSSVISTGGDHDPRVSLPPTTPKPIMSLARYTFRVTLTNCHLAEPDKQTVGMAG